MSLHDLFPINVGRRYLIRFAASDRRNSDAYVGHHAEMCQRCGSLVIDRDRHHRWHQAVDTGATTALPSDSAPPLVGGGAPQTRRTFDDRDSPVS